MIKTHNVLFFILFTFCFSAYSQNGKITGKLTDKDFNNESLPFANVLIKGTAIGAATDENGKYSLSISPGTHTVQFSFLGYETVEETVTIGAGESKTIDKALGSGSYTLEDVVIQAVGSRERETALLVEQKKAIEIKQSIGAQEMSRKGISNVEEGLTKITGISKVESRGLFIRGLEDRYNNLLVNGLAVPSNSPFKKILPLDLFPTDVVGYMDIYKTFNPDIYADFGGATININTTQATKSQTKISYGAGFTTGNNLNKFKIAADANNSENFFGFGGNVRELPAGFGSAPAGRTSNEFDSGWNVDEITAPLNSSFGISHSGAFELDDQSKKLSYLFAANFDNKYLVRKGVDRIFSQGQGNYDNNLNRSQYRFQTSASALFGLNYKGSRAKYFFNAMYLKSTEHLIQDQIGYTRTSVQNPNEIIRLNQFEQSDYINAQLYGDYDLTTDQKHTLKGGVSFTNTKFRQPDRKFINGTMLNDDEIQTTYGGNHLIRQFLDVDGSFYLSGALEYKYKFGRTDRERQNNISIGVNGFATEMESTYRFVFGKPNSSSTVIVPLNNIDTFLDSDLSNGLFSYREESNSDYNTKITQNVSSAYANVHFNLSDKTELNAGIRAEHTFKEIRYRDIGSSFNSPFKIFEIDQLDILPSVNVKFAMTDRTNLRLAASKTITRPVLIETMPIQYINADGTSERGNERLENSQNYNADLKFEFFPTNKEMFAATIFGKLIDKPIERTIESSGTGSGQTITYFNNKQAILFGAEFEMLLQLNRLTETLDDFSFGFNTTIMHTRSEVDKNRPGYFDTFEERPLQGASNWLINSDLKYEIDFSENWKNTMTAAYNVYGKRIYAVGIADFDHIYEMPFSKLDFIWSANIKQKWDVKLSVENILNSRYTKELGDDSRIDVYEPSLILEDYKRGTTFSINVSYTF